ncbi:MAG: MGMT family protein, partial [Candidatus Paceibacteria bacterium]
KQIPAGETLTYKQVAERAGNPKAAQAVGQLMKRNTRTDVPCHRVIRSDGSLGGYNHPEGTKKKERRLEKEKKKDSK